MSKITLEPNQSGAGTFSIQSPDSNSNRVLTLPDNDGTVATVENLPPGYEDQDALDLFNATGSAPVYAVRAWVHFDGTGTPSIKGSGNVSSVTDLGLGRYNVNFAVNMPDDDYAAVASGNTSEGSFNVAIGIESNQNTVDKTQVTMDKSNGESIDRTNVQVIVTR